TNRSATVRETPRNGEDTARSRGKRPPRLVIRAVREENVLLAEWLTSLGPAVLGILKLML
ncbi:unnamed protein product, partial [Musa banksii]